MNDLPYRSVAAGEGGDPLVCRSTPDDQAPRRLERRQVLARRSLGSARPGDSAALRSQRRDLLHPRGRAALLRRRLRTPRPARRHDLADAGRSARIRRLLGRRSVPRSEHPRHARPLLPRRRRTRHPQRPPQRTRPRLRPHRGIEPEARHRDPRSTTVREHRRRPPGRLTFPHAGSSEEDRLGKRWRLLPETSPADRARVSQETFPHTRTRRGAYSRTSSNYLERSHCLRVISNSTSPCPRRYVGCG